MIRRVMITVALMAMASSGCSLIEAPEPGHGSGEVSLRLVRSQASDYAMRPGMAGLAEVLPNADSIMVSVYRPGSGSTPEASQGAGIPAGTDTIEVSLSVIAENDKRVAVELFVAGRLSLFGVDQDVDVLANQNTHVSITAVQFELGSISVSPPRIWDGEPFAMRWSSVPGAAAYHVQESPAPDFSVIAWQTFTTDTFIAGPLPAGDYYFRIAAQNVYTKSEWSTTQLHVGGAPQVTSIAAREVLRDESDVEFDVNGFDLDHPSTAVTVFGQDCQIVDPPGLTPTRLTMRVRVPARAYSGAVTVANNSGSDDSSELIRVQTIAYIAADVSSGDLARASDYKSLIESYGGVVRNSAVLIVPYPAIDGLDMGLFDLVIVGWDTGNTELDWGGGGFAGQIRAAEIWDGGAAVLGIGTGGASYFELVGLDIGIGSCFFAPGKDVLVVDSAADIFNVPIDIKVSNAERLDIYSIDVDDPIRLGAVVDVSNPPLGVSVYASQTDNPITFAYVDQSVSKGGPGPARNFLWGFSGLDSGPQNLSADGAGVFENVVKFVFDSGSGGAIPLSARQDR
ncbi:MAG: hypothetical protein OEN01_09385 [Candidatus Krumholzibacteria bacterium]|nr:hypothetical protein [Candidatus Krumholzibacteria bacterium]